MKSKSLCLLVGAPGCGKSTFAQSSFGRDRGAKIISRDTIRFTLLEDGDEYFSKEQEVWNTFIYDINAALLNPEINRVIVDATHLNHKNRERVLRYIPQVQRYQLVAYMFTASIETCLERNAKRTGRANVPEDQIRRMHGAMTDPRNDKRFVFDRVYYVGEHGDIYEKSTRSQEVDMDG